MKPGVLCPKEGKSQPPVKRKEKKVEGKQLPWGSAKGVGCQYDQYGGNKECRKNRKVPYWEGEKDIDWFHAQHEIIEVRPEQKKKQRNGFVPRQNAKSATGRIDGAEKKKKSTGPSNWGNETSNRNFVSTDRKYDRNNGRGPVKASKMHIKGAETGQKPRKKSFWKKHKKTDAAGNREANQAFMGVAKIGWMVVPETVLKGGKNKL